MVVASCDRINLYIVVEHFKAFVRSSNHIPAFVYAPGMREVTTWCTNTPCVMG